MRVAYLGPPGTFSDEALAHCDLTIGAEAFPFARLAEVHQAALEGSVDLAIMPIENSIEGAVGSTLDLLVHRAGLLVRREVLLPIEQCLLARAGARLDELTRVLSHPQALGQCRAFIETHLKHAQLEPTHSTGDAARRAATEDGAAAIGSRAAADRYGLAVVAERIHDAEENTTRFVVLGFVDEAPTGRDRTSIALSLDQDRPGGLHAVLGELASRDINLSKVESRPAKRTLGHYVFFLDFEGHRRDPACAEALEAVARRADRILVLGSYPRA